MKPSARVLGVYPFSHGFGWIVFETPSAPVDWGVVEKKKDRNAQCLFAIERIALRYEPTVIVLEAFDRPPKIRAARIRRLCKSIIAFAVAQRMTTHVYARSDIRGAFAATGGPSRREIATAIAAQIESLRSRLPQKRAIWESERPNMALFNAAALALTHYAVTRGRP